MMLGSEQSDRVKLFRDANRRKPKDLKGDNGFDLRDSC